MSDATNSVAIPDKLVLGGVTYNVGENPELDAFRSACVKNAGQIEKNKLYSQMNELKTKILELKDVKVTPNSTEAVDINKLKTELLTELTTSFGSQLNSALEPFKKQSEDSRKRDVNEYRNQLLIANQTKIIPELVVGNTKEELDAALQNSIKLFAQYGKPSDPIDPTGSMQSTTINANPANTQNNTTPAPVVDVTPVTAPPRMDNPTPQITNVKGMKVEDYAKRREQLLAEADKMIGG